MQRRIKPPPEWLGSGSLVHYHPVIGEPHDGKVYRVRDDGEPQLLSGHTWVVWLDGKAGCVCCDAVSRVADAEEG